MDEHAAQSKKVGAKWKVVANTGMGKRWHVVKPYQQTFRTIHVCTYIICGCVLISKLNNLTD